MHANDVHRYGHAFIISALDGLDEQHYETDGVCGEWSVKDVIGHLAAFEGALVEVLQDILGIEGPTPFMETMRQHGPVGFNDVEYEKRRDKSFAEVMTEYNEAQTRVAELLQQIPVETQRQAGLLEWYGPEYDLEDFIVYSYYAHKREHGAQINLLKDRVQSDA